MKALISGCFALVLAVALAPAADAQGPSYAYGPTVLEITTPVLVAFEKGLRAEIVLREELKKQLADRTAKAKFDKCVMDLMTTADSQRFGEGLAAVVTGVKPEEIQHRMLRFYGAVQARLEAKCGKDPGSVSNVASQRQLETVEQKAVSVAGPIP
jgi:hypothetical protein